MSLVGAAEVIQKPHMIAGTTHGTGTYGTGRPGGQVLGGSNLFCQEILVKKSSDKGPIGFRAPEHVSGFSGPQPGATPNRCSPAAVKRVGKESPEARENCDPLKGTIVGEPVEVAQAGHPM